jgi:hypothetical protein
MNAMSCRSATSHPCTIWHRVDGSPVTVAALLHSTIEPPCSVVCPLCVTSRPTPYCPRLDVPMSCMHLMLPIHRVWLSCTHLMCCLLHVPGEVMMSLMSGILGTYGHTSEASGPNQVSRSAKYFPFACGHSMPRALWHVAMPEPSRVGRGGGQEP